MSKSGKLIGALVILASLGASVVEAVSAYTEYEAISLAELECVNTLLVSTDRIDIATGNGTCWAEENGYYK